MQSYFYHIAFELPHVEELQSESKRGRAESELSPSQPESQATTVTAWKRCFTEFEQQAEPRDSQGAEQRSQDRRLLAPGASRQVKPRRLSGHPVRHPERTKSSVRDRRLDRISIESFDLVPAQSQQGQLTSAGSSVAAAGMEVGAGGFAAKGKFVPVEGDSLELGWGVVHLYRDAEPTPGLCGDDGDDHARAGSRKAVGGTQGNKRQSRARQEDCTTLCVLAVPYYVTPLDFLGFVGEKTREEVSHFRMVRTERVNRYMVLMKFRDAKKAREWRQEWNGKAFNGMEPEYCHVVFVKSIQLQTPDGGDDSTTYPSLTNDPLTPQSSLAKVDAVGSSKLAPSTLSKKPIAPPTPSLVELPTCPVCLERMDETTGLLTILCQHVFHCACLQRWRGSGCPVCRYTQGGGADASWALGKPERKLEDEACGVCGSDANLWVCLVCGNVGCGRYDEAHAFSHYVETSHCYAMDIDTQRVWDYAADGYVHRLIQNKPDGKLVELPSPYGDTLVTAEGDDGTSDDPSDPQRKLDSIGMEYTYLLTSQLESQRQYFEEKIAQAADKAFKASQAAEASAASAQGATEALARLEARHRSLTEEAMPALEREKARAERRAEKLSETARRMEREWRDEKAMTESLLSKVEHLTKEVETLKARNEDLHEQNRDLSFFISGQERIRELGGDDDDVREGTVSVGEASSGGDGGKRRKNRGKR